MGSYGAGPASIVHTEIRKCAVCELPLEQRSLIEVAMRRGSQYPGEGAVAVMRALGLDLTPPVLSRHKTLCLGLPSTRNHNTVVVAAELAIVGEESVTEPPPTVREAPPAVWVPPKARELGRQKLLSGLDNIELQIARTPTAAYYQVRLEYIREILKESEKGGGDLADRMKGYEEEVQSRKREVTRTMTLKETVTIEPTGQEVAISSEARAL